MPFSRVAWRLLICRLMCWKISKFLNFKFESRRSELAAEGDFDVFDDGVGREIKDVGEVDAGFELHVVNRAGGFIVEMAVLIEVRAVAGWLAVEVHLADDFMLNQRLKAVVNRCQRDVWEGFLDPHENFVCRGMCTLAHQESIDFLALPCHAEAIDLLRDVRLSML